MNPRQVKSGVLWAKSIRDETADTTGIFNSVSVSIGLSDQDLRILRRRLGQAKWNKNMLLFFKSYLVNSKTHLFFFGGIFDELEITNDTKINYPTETGPSLSINLNWKVIRKLYQDRQLSSICTLSKWLLRISPKKNILLLLETAAIRIWRPSFWKYSKTNGWQDRHIQQCFCGYRPKWSFVAEIATTIGQANWKKIM